MGTDFSLEATESALPSPNSYLKIPEIKGDATHKEYRDQIAISSFQYRQSQNKEVTTGDSKSNFATQDIQLMAPGSSASPLLMQHSAHGKTFKSVTLTVLSSDAQKVIMTIELTDVIISSYQTHVLGSGHPVDYFTLNFRKIEFRYTGPKPDGSAGKNTSGQYDLGKVDQ